MIKFSDKENKEARIMAFELFAYCLSAGPCNKCIFFDRNVPGDPCVIGCPNAWPLFDTRSKTGLKNREAVLKVLK